MKGVAVAMTGWYGFRQAIGTLMEKSPYWFGRILRAAGFAISRVLALLPGLTNAFGIAFITILWPWFSSQAEVPLSPNGPIVGIEIEHSHPGTSPSGAGTDINLAYQYKALGVESGSGKAGWSLHEEFEVLSYDEGHVQISVKLKNGTPGTGKLSGGLSTYSTVVNVTKEKPVILKPFEDITVRILIESKRAAANPAAATPHS